MDEKYGDGSKSLFPVSIGSQPSISASSTGSKAGGGGGGGGSVTSSTAGSKKTPSVSSAASGSKLQPQSGQLRKVESSASGGGGGGGGGGPALLGVLSLQQKSAEQKRSKKQKELDSVPEPEIDFMDVKAEMVEFLLQSGKAAYNARDKGEVLHWKDCAQLIKDEADREFGPTWHCIVGTEFGSFVTFEKSSVIFFHVGMMKVLLWKHG